MEIVYLKLSEITPYQNNPRKNENAVVECMESIKRYGFNQSLVLDKNKVIIVGHTRYKASQRLGLESIPCVIADHLTDAQIKEYRLVDNKVGEKAKWDETKLAVELSAIDFDMSLFGFEQSIKDAEDIVADIPFATELREEHNYLVLYFTNEVDWLQALTAVDMKTVQTLPNRIDGTINPKSARKGLGRVVDGVKAIEAIRGSQ